MFLSRLGVTALDGLAKTKESDKVLQGKSWCTLARSASDPKQQLSAYLKALESLDGRFERVDCLVEMGEWATGKGLVRSGADYLRSALDLLYDVEVEVYIEPTALLSTAALAQLLFFSESVSDFLSFILRSWIQYDICTYSKYVDQLNNTVFVSVNDVHTASITDYTNLVFIRLFSNSNQRRGRGESLLVVGKTYEKHFRTH